MKTRIKELEIKIDKIIETQQLILNKLDENIIIPNQLKPLPKVSTKQAKADRENYFKKLIEENFALMPHKTRLQREFNLATKPHSNRVKAYLKTKNPSVFDGLKRN